MSSGPMQFAVSVRITHEATDEGPRRLAEPFRAFLDRDTREEAEAVVAEFWEAAVATGMEPYLVTEITPVRGPSAVAAEILPGGGAILGERLADIIDLSTWSETRFVTPRQAVKADRGGPRADYLVVEATDEAVFLIDLDVGGWTVTNDAEAVVAAVLERCPGRRVVYRDTMGRWDELCHDGRAFTGFAPWGGPVPAVGDGPGPGEWS